MERQSLTVEELLWLWTLDVWKLVSKWHFGCDSVLLLSQWGCDNKIYLYSNRYIGLPFRNRINTGIRYTLVLFESVLCINS